MENYIEFKKKVKKVERDLGEDVFERHAWNTDIIRDYILNNMAKTKQCKNIMAEINAEDLEMFQLRNLHYNIESLYSIDDLSDDYFELEDVFYKSLYEFVSANFGIENIELLFLENI